MAILTFDEAFKYSDSCKIKNLPKEKIVEIILSDEFFYYHTESGVKNRLSLLGFQWEDFKQFFNGESNSLVHAIVDDEYPYANDICPYPREIYYKYILKEDIEKYDKQECLMEKLGLDNRAAVRYYTEPLVNYCITERNHPSKKHYCRKKIVNITLDENGIRNDTYAYFDCITGEKICDEPPQKQFCIKKNLINSYVDF